MQIDDGATAGIAYVPYFPLGGFTPLQSTALSDVAKRLDATPMQVTLAWLLKRAPNILLIPGTSSLGHLRETSRLPKWNYPPTRSPDWTQSAKAERNDDAAHEAVRSV